MTLEQKVRSLIRHYRTSGSISLRHFDDEQTRLRKLELEMFRVAIIEDLESLLLEEEAIPPPPMGDSRTRKYPVAVGD